MPTWRRRSVLATCAALSTTGVLASIGSTTAEGQGDSEGATSSSGWLDGPEGWSSARGNAANSRHLPLEGEFPKPDTEAWRYDLPDVEYVETAVVDGAVYVRTGGEIHAIDADDGDLEWATDADATGAPAVFDGTVYVTGERHLAALDAADGDLKWEREFETDESLADPTIAFETIYLVVDGALCAIDPADGSTRWSVETLDVRADAYFWQSDDRVPTSFRPETVAVANGTVYAALESATFTDEHDGEEDEVELSSGFGAVDAETGDRVWGVAFTPPHAGGPVAEPIMARGSSVNVNLGGGTGEYTFDAETGDGLYYERNMRTSTETAYVNTYWDVNGDLTVFEGGERWTVQSDAYAYAWQAPLIVGDTLIADHFATTPEYVESDYPERSLVAFDIADGTERWILDFGEQLSDSGGMPAADENTLYLETSGALVALRASDADDAEPDDGDESDHGDDEPEDDDGDEGGSDDADSDCPDEGSESDCPEGDDGGSADDDPGDEDDSNNDDDGSGVGEDDGDAADDGDDDPDTNGDEDEIDGDGDEATDDEGDADDDVPGFTTGAGILGGALGLEWLRRTASVDEPSGEDEPAE